MVNFHLKILDLNEGCTINQIHKSYRKLIKQWHPDKFESNTKDQLIATEKSKLIIKAYDFLKNHMPQEVQSADDGNKILRTQVRSSNVFSIGYSSRKMILQVEFKNGGVYEYYKVPMSLYNDLMKALSKGKFLNAHISGKYDYTRIN